MLRPTEPINAKELSDILRDCGESRRTLEIGGAFSKQAAGGAIFPADVKLSTCNLDQIIAYEPRDLTISVGAGLRYRDLRRVLAEKNQFLPLDPPFAENATIGGIIATNGNGPRRRRYGTARDMVIGMKFVTIEGKTVQSGGMVVKNVTGLDMGKLMIGAYGTLAVVTVVNFKVFPIPSSRLTILFSSTALTSLTTIRAEILNSIIQPRAIDLFNVEAARKWDLASVSDLDEYGLAVEIEGSLASITRCRHELDAVAKQHSGVTVHSLDSSETEVFWRKIQETTAQLLSGNSDVYVIKLATLPTRTREIFEIAEEGKRKLPVVVRAGNALGYIYTFGIADTERCLLTARAKGLKAVVEYMPIEQKSGFDQWPDPGSDFLITERIKNEFDPQNLLNRGRLFNRL